MWACARAYQNAYPRYTGVRVQCVCVYIPAFCMGAMRSTFGVCLCGLGACTEQVCKAVHKCGGTYYVPDTYRVSAVSVQTQRGHTPRSFGCSPEKHIGQKKTARRRPKRRAVPYLPRRLEQLFAKGSRSYSRTITRMIWNSWAL